MLPRIDVLSAGEGNPRLPAIGTIALARRRQLPNVISHRNKSFDFTEQHATTMQIRYNAPQRFDTRYGFAPCLCQRMSRR
ncbi:hypothetical protein GPA22_07210 [Aromatoleum toluvorans]|uniref:Uncharacterized protein n=1 Tax=Aromatoleum toluvorans TaxID=92002 RepID=A0ABX1PZ53_9RHOO|nr:hypothetical protein [Aromatoleum toluvorans]NMG43520.1 hypothetical protein [Aromatoleum toluvorans]